MKKISDPIVLGAVVGAISCTLKEIVSQASVKKGLIPYNGAQKAAGMIVPAYDVRTPKGMAVGLLMDIVIGSGIATGLGALHKKGTLKVNPLNGSLIGLGCWAFFYGVLGSFSSMRKTTPKGALVTAGWHAVFGAVAGTLVPLLGETESKTSPQTTDPERTGAEPKKAVLSKTPTRDGYR